MLLAALALHDAPPLGLALPADLDPKRDADRDVFWHAHAVAFAPVVRASRRAWRAVQIDEGAAGNPDRPGLMYRMEDGGEPDRQNDVRATVDLLGLLGLGPKAAERELAAEVTGLAHGKLEEAVWSAAFAVDRARVRLAAARQFHASLEQHLISARAGLRRIRMLQERGRLGEGLVSRAQAVLASLETDLSFLARDVARAREALAHAAGVPAHATAIETLHDDLIDREITLPLHVPKATELLVSVPTLRSRQLAYAVAEARLRAAAAEWWPRLQIGPHFKIRPDELLSGGVVSLDLPWPATVEANIDAAVERRTQAREAVVDALAAAVASVETRRDELRYALEHRTHHARRLDVESARAWRAARARLEVLEGADVVDTWIDALQLRAKGALAPTGAARHVLLTDLAYREIAGKLPGLDAGPAAPGRGAGAGGSP
ncbi:MAG: hypothetical protein CMJ83_03285 [Planctomycetes bacterium]|nr:hypothetical protein [Planctomycetota bacterium]